MNRRSTVAGWTARDKFAKGDRVKLSARGIQHLRTMRRKGKRAYDHDTRGTVVGFGHSPEVVAIVRDGLVTREAFHLTLWELAE